MSKDIWNNISLNSVFTVGNIKFDNGLWFGSVSVQVLSKPMKFKDKQVVKVKVLSSTASNKEMIFKYVNGKPIALNQMVPDFETYIPLEVLIGFGFNQTNSGNELPMPPVPGSF